MTEDGAREAYERLESDTARAFAEMVGSRGFGWMFARSAENIAAVVRISADVSDLVLRNLRLAGRADITRVARQLHRTEDKLELVLQEVEALRDELAERERAPRARANGRAPRRPAARARTDA